MAQRIPGNFSTVDWSLVATMGNTMPPRDPNDDDELPSHLRDPMEDPEDCWGPVPPVTPDPYVQQDPFVRDSSPLPSPPIKR